MLEEQDSSTTDRLFEEACARSVMQSNKYTALKCGELKTAEMRRLVVLGVAMADSDFAVSITPDDLHLAEAVGFANKNLTLLLHGTTRDNERVYANASHFMHEFRLFYCSL